MSDSVDIKELVNSTAAAAQRAGLDTGVVGNALESLRAAVTGDPSVFDLWLLVDEQIGKAQSHDLQQLIRLRTCFEEEMYAAVGRRMNGAFEQAHDIGWKAWLGMLADAITRFRLTFSDRLFEYSFPFQESDKETLRRLRKAVRYMDQIRWPEAYEQLRYLAGQDFLPALIRARLLCILAQIQLFHFRNGAAAHDFLDTAEYLSPDEPRVLSVWGDYWITENDLGEKDIEKARSYYERAIAMGPTTPGGYVGVGEYFENEKEDLEEARRWYQKAIDAAPGDSLGYTKLFRLFGRPEFFKEHAPELVPLMERAIAVSPEDEYQLHVDFGNVYEQNLQPPEARNWYQKAIALDPSRPSAYVALAQSFEKENRFDEAKPIYSKVIEMVPESYEGYLGLGWVAEQQGKWEEALEWYQRTPKHVKELAGLFQARVGEMVAKLKRYSEAEEIEKQLLRIDKNNETAKSVLQTIADEYYKEHDDREKAIRLYGEIFEILGNSYSADYHNRLGNVSYFYDDYKHAASEYRLAIEAYPRNAVFHRNLALAYKELKQYEQCTNELSEALRLDGETDLFNKEMALRLNAEANDYYGLGDFRKAIELYGTAIDYDPTNDVIHSNLGRGWENIKEPGTRVEALDKAIDASQKAYDIKANEKYAADIEALLSKKEFALRYGENAADRVHLVTPIAVELAENLVSFVEGSTPNSLSEELSTHLADMKTRVESQFGVKLPGVRFRGNDTDFLEGLYVLMINEIPLSSGVIPPNQRFFPGAKETLAGLKVEGTEAINPVTREAGFWIDQLNWRQVEEAGLELWPVVEYIIRHLESVIQGNLAGFTGHQEVIEMVENVRPLALEELRSTPTKLTALTAVCRALLAEGAPITPFGEIYDVVDQLCTEDANPQNIVETVRSLPAVLPRLPGNDARHSVMPLGPRFEDEIRKAIYHAGSYSVLAMAAERCQEALAAIRNAAGDGRDIVIVVEDAQLRPFVRLLIEIEFPNIPILSRREVRPDIEFKKLPIVELETEPISAKPDFTGGRHLDSSSQNLKDLTTGESETSRELGITVFANQDVVGKRGIADEQSVEEMFSLAQDGLFYELGIMIPEVHLERDSVLGPNEFRFEINGHKGAPIEGLQADEFLVNETVDRLKPFDIIGTKRINPATGVECSVVQEKEGLLEMCKKAGLVTWGPAEFIVLALSGAIRKNAASFQTVDLTRYIIQSLRPLYPDLIATALNRFSVEQICLVLINLLAEEISIRDQRSILESLLSINGTTDVDLNRYIVLTPPAQNLCPITGNRGLRDLTMAECTDVVRTSLKKYITYKYTKGVNTLNVYLIDREIEGRLADTARSLTAEEKESFIEGVKFAIGDLPATAQNPILLTSMDVRRAVKDLIKLDFPDLAVLSYQELSPDTSIQRLGWITWSPTETRSSAGEVFPTILPA
jgi:type III secretory pathway component EscV/tetratricopeptide (TPR) repeat protein